MVLYFSATGNTEFVAKKLAGKLGCGYINLLERIKKKDYSEISSKEPYVICAPIYVCEMPRFLSTYLRKVKLTGSRDIYFIFTSGGYMGCAGIMAKSICKKKEMNYKGSTEFVMANNYFIRDSYMVPTKEVMEKRIAQVKADIETVVEKIQSGERLICRHVFFIEKLVTIPVNPIWSRYKLTADKFYTTKQCIGCGKCQKVCPLNNISLSDKKPLWGKNCSHCMACIAKCPMEAIEYGQSTVGRQRYLFEKYNY